ncbi:TetR/AcrR family transcriptional regulator [Paenibacillus sp. SI8]|uniref:TetR/AcrR family transcriptional regulator n=1 Tax=unclassified Paenibacillus TaxID=185978 RepID=UPI003466EE79
MDSATPHPRKPGRPRSEQTDQAILQAARELMLECGVQSFSMDTLAARAGVSKPTIYRRWSNKEDLLSDTIGQASDQTVIPDTGNVIEDLRILLGNMLESINLNFGLPSQSINKMLASFIDSPQLTEQYRNKFILPRRKIFEAIINKGIQRGEIRGDVNTETLVDLVSGAYFYCMLFKPKDVVSSVWLENVCDVLALGVINAPE